MVTANRCAVPTPLSVSHHHNLVRLAVVNGQVEVPAGGQIKVPTPCRAACSSRNIRGSDTHLPVRVRDGTGLVGPLVLPGVTSCLGGH